jgi:hypothetical protein
MHPLVENEHCPAALPGRRPLREAARSHSSARRDRFLPRPNGSGRVRDDPQRIQTEQTREETMNDLQAIADRFEIEALRGEFTDAAMMRH